jgi:hypothetical protein
LDFQSAREDGNTPVPDGNEVANAIERAFYIIY